MRFWFAVDTLEYLRRGGRIGAAQAWLGGALKIKPILTLDGRDHADRARPHAKRAFERMVEYLRARQADGADGWVVQHVQSPEVADRLSPRGREIFGCEPAFVSEVGPVIGAHVGPGLVGVGGIPRALLGLTRAQRRRKARRSRRSRRRGRTRPPAAPISTCFWWVAICLRQSVISVTSPRRRSSECASWTRLSSIEARICSGVRVGHQIVVLRVLGLHVSWMRLASSMASPASAASRA